ncbi:trypsin-like serine peptidase [Rhodophyticola porphyridii]|uniref:S1 family peptidase n=1 Tax=Rhodophyticola porphyridii TaxID=1852017 RepID=A0A3L9Y9K5_9RHOB|nr:trypsin-like serine protease [Rhodophyticola porphyridii]RMA43968.1 S1 family peptidase [Rhodophyticola porphyridii]
MKAIFPVVAIALALAVPAMAQTLQWPNVEPDTPLRPLDSAYDLRGWEAVGRLDTGSGFCTATLIAPDLVLTAAHCLFDGPEDSATRRPDAALSFNAGLRNGYAVAQRGIRRSILHPDYTYGSPDDLHRIRTDIALLQLDHTIPEQTVRPIATRGSVGPGDIVQVVSYGAEREEYASLEDDCEVLAEDPGVLVLSCSVVQGSSGSPVMVDRDGQMNVVSVVSALADWGDEPVALSAELQGELVVLLDLLDRSNAQFVRSLPQVRTLSGSNDGRESSGARFLRP